MRASIIAVAVFAVLTCSLLTVPACKGNDSGVTTGSGAEGSKAAPEKTAKGPVTMPSGLIYEVIEPGTGKRPKLTDRVTVHYRGTLTDGTEFDSSYRRGAPATFAVNRVIKGWTEALQLMREGAKWKLTIPPDLAYGKRGAGSTIGPDATLIFEVELIKVD